MWEKCFKLCLVSVLLSGCVALSSKSSETSSVAPLILTAKWLNDSRIEQTYFPDPQPSGLTFWEGKLVSISDASALEQNRRRLHFIDPNTAKVTFSETYMVSPDLATHCFTEYFKVRPDLEALAKDPLQDNTFITVTEDASLFTGYSLECAEQYQSTGSTEFPTVLVRLRYDERSNRLLVIGLRAVQFDINDAIGNSPNDGIEGLVATSSTLYLGLEKDSYNQAQLFTIEYSLTFWESEQFAIAQKMPVNFPNYNPNRPNPINAIDLFEWRGDTWLLAAARNDNELWWVNLTEVGHPIYRTQLRYRLANPNGCPEFEFLDNASIEGVAVSGNQLYLVNDPWKRNYAKNIQCEAWREAYEAFAPQLYQINLDTAWEHTSKITLSRGE